MARITFNGDALDVTMTVGEQLLAFHGSFQIPLEHVTGAYVSDLRGLHLRWRLLGTGMGTIMTAGIFTTPEGTIFCDLHGDRGYLVIETRGERFKRLAFTLDDDQDSNAIAQEIVRRVMAPH